MTISKHCICIYHIKACSITPSNGACNSKKYIHTRNAITLKRRKSINLKLKKKEEFKLWKEYCNVSASSNPWYQVYKLATGKIRTNSIMTTLGKPDGTETSSILETMNIVLDHFIKDNRWE